MHPAYARTDYEADGSRVLARVGERCAGTDAWLRRQGARQAAFITAWNSMSRRMPVGWNERMLARLREAARRHPMAEGWGRARPRLPRRPSGVHWAERHLLLAADPRAARVLARRFRQRAILVLRVGAPARLLYC